MRCCPSASPPEPDVAMRSAWYGTYPPACGLMTFTLVYRASTLDCSCAHTNSVQLSIIASAPTTERSCKL